MRIIIVSHDMPPSEQAGAVRPATLAAALVSRGHDVTVVTAQPDAAGAGYEVAVVPYTRLWTRAKQAVGVRRDENAAEVARGKGHLAEALVRALARSAEVTLMYPDRYHRWIDACGRWAEEHAASLAGTGVVIGTAPPMSAAFAAARIADTSAARLVVDLRDLWTDNLYYPYGRLRRAIDGRAEDRLLASASAVVTTTEAFARRLRSRYPRLPVDVIPTGLSRRTRDPLPGPLRVVFLGRTYEGRRDLKPVLRAVGSLPAGEIRLAVAGDVDEAAFAVVPATAEIRGRVPRSEAERLAAEADVVLCPMWPEDTDAVPLKAIEAIVTGTALLVTGAAPDSEIRRALAGVDGVFFAGGEADARETLERLAALKRGSGVLEWAWSSRERFSAEHMCDGFERAIRDG